MPRAGAEVKPISKLRDPVSPRCPSCISTAGAASSASVLLRHGWSRGAGCWGPLCVLAWGLRLPCLPMSLFHTGRLWEQQRWPPRWAAALPTSVPHTRAHSCCLPSSCNVEWATFCSIKAVNITQREIMFSSVSQCFAFQLPFHAIQTGQSKKRQFKNSSKTKACETKWEKCT